MSTAEQTTQPDTNGQALEKTSAKTPQVITTPSQYRDALSKWSSHYNILTPFTDVSGIAPSFGIIASVVKIDADQTHGEVYSGTTPTGAKGMPFLKGQPGTPGEELALAKIGLRKIAECGGISTSTVRTDPRTIPHYWEFKATASYRGLDGTVITREATFEWDLRDGSDRLKGWTAQQITEGRKNGLRNCEARAINAAIRECGCGIKQKYTRAELERPFVVIRVAFQPDMNDPAVKQAVTMRALEGTSTLYQGTTRELPATYETVEREPETDQPRSVGSGSTTAATPAKSEAPKADLPPVEGAVRIAKTDTKTGEKNGRKWTKYLIVDSNGQEFSTFDKQHYDDANRFKAEYAWVEIVTETNGAFVNIIEIVRAGSQPSLPGVEDL